MESPDEPDVRAELVPIRDMLAADDYRWIWLKDAKARRYIIQEQKTRIVIAEIGGKLMTDEQQRRAAQFIVFARNIFLDCKLQIFRNVK